MTDEWTVSEDSYSVDKFFTGSTNKKGFGKTIRIQVPPGLLDVLGGIIASKDIPEYRTSPDFLRDAIYHRLQYVVSNIDSIKKRPEAKKMARMLQLQAELDMMDQERKSADQLVQSLQAQLINVRNDKDLTHLHEIARSAIDGGLPDWAVDKIHTMLHGTI